MYYSFLYIAIHFVEFFFISICMKGIGLIIFVILVLFFLLMSLSDFGIGETLAMQNELGSIPSSLTFWRRLYRMDTISSSDVKQNY